MKSKQERTTGIWVCLLAWAASISVTSAQSVGPQEQVTDPIVCNMYQYRLAELLSLPPAACADFQTPKVPMLSQGNGPFEAFPLTGCTDGNHGCDLPTDLALCRDGTTPLMYINPSQARDPENVNRWVFWLQGGASMGEKPTISLWQDSYLTGYRLANDLWKHSSTNFAEHWHCDAGQPCPFPTAMHPIRRRFGGVSSDHPRNPMRNAHRVVIQKCSPDRWIGNSESEVAFDLDGDHSDELRVLLYHHGSRILESAFRRLNTAAIQPHVTWHKEDASQADVVLPSLSDAEQIIIVGSSAGGMGLMTSANKVQALLATIAPDADVKFVIDSSIVDFPSLEGQFGPDKSITVWSENTENKSTLLCTGDGADVPVIVRSSHAAFEAGASRSESGYFRTWFGTWGDEDDQRTSILNKACVRAHPDDPSPCYNPYHVLFHHNETDMMIIQNLYDGNKLESDRHTRAFTALYGDDQDSSTLQWRGVGNQGQRYDCSAHLAERLAVAGSELLHNRDRNHGTTATRDNDLAMFMVETVPGREIENEAPASKRGEHHELLKTDETYLEACVFDQANKIQISVADALARWASGDPNHRSVIMRPLDRNWPYPPEDTQSHMGGTWQPHQCG